MGFLDKAKKLAEQAQDKLDDVQKQFNQGQPAATGPAVEYDQHGRPTAASPPAQSTGPPPHGDPLGSEAASQPDVPKSEPDEPRSAPDPPTSAPAAAASEPEPPKSEHAPPKLSSGDPLAG